MSEPPEQPTPCSPRNVNNLVLRDKISITLLWAAANGLPKDEYDAAIDALNELFKRAA